MKEGTSISVTVEMLKKTRTLSIESDFVTDSQSWDEKLLRVAAFANDPEYQSRVRVMLHFPNPVLELIDEFAAATVGFREWEVSYAREKGIRDAREVATAFSAVAEAILRESNAR